MYLNKIWSIYYASQKEQNKGVGAWKCFKFFLAITLSVTLPSIQLALFILSAIWFLKDKSAWNVTPCIRPIGVGKIQIRLTTVGRFLSLGVHWCFWLTNVPAASHSIIRDEVCVHVSYASSLTTATQYGNQALFVRNPPRVAPLTL